MADLRIVDAPVLLQESITDDVKMPTGGLGNFSIRLGDIVWYVVTKEQLANKNYVDLSSKSVKDSLDEHIADKANPHNVTKAQVGLGNVDNTADIDKPVSNAAKTYIDQQDALKADKTTTYTKTEVDTKVNSVSGGYIGAFATMSELNAKTGMTVGQVAKVMNDSATSNNGDYYYNGTAWVKGYDSLTDAKAYTDKTVKQDSVAIYTHKFVDANSNVMAAIDVEGGLYLVGLDGTVQEVINSNKTSIASVNTSLNDIAQSAPDTIYTHKFVDANSNVMAAIDVEGGLYLVGLDGTVQEVINSNKDSSSENGIAITKDTTLATTRKKTDIFTADTQQVLNMQRYANINAAPAPLDLHKRIYTISNTWLDSIKFSRPASKTVIKTPYRDDDGVVHPHIIEFYNGFRGYRYLLKLEPYYNTIESYENPCIYGSNDLVNFTLLDGFTQPLANPPTNPYGTSHNSDGVFAYDQKSGDLILVFRETIRNYQGGADTYDAWSMRKTKDGYTWTDKEYLLEPRITGSGFNTASPAILYDPIKDEWHIYIGTGNGVQHYVKKSLNKDNWQLPTTIATPSGTRVWHMDARYVGNKIVALVHDQANGQFRFGISSDFVNFTWSTSSVYTEISGEITTDKYKASFIPKFDDDGQLAFTVLWTSRHDSSDVSKRWNLFINDTNYVNAQVEFI